MSLSFVESMSFIFTAGLCRYFDKILGAEIILILRIPILPRHFKDTFEGYL